MLATLVQPWRTARTWWTLVHLVTGGAVAAVIFTVVLTLLTTAVSVVILLPVAVVLGWLTLVAAQRLTRADRSRFAALLDVDLPERATTPPTAPADGWSGSWARRWASMAATLRSGDRWREVAWSILHFPVAVTFATVAPALWAASAVAVTLPLWVQALPGNRSEPFFLRIDAGWEAAAVGALGVVLLAVVVPWCTVAMGRVDVAVARWLLGRSREAELVAEVETLTTSRAAAVDSAEAERRRIERDLHDGAQQRLIAVAMDLGLAREKLDTDPARAAEYVAAAHEDVKAAMKELRDLVRGIHPVILEDRGLDAALSAVVARAAVPVTLKVDVAVRPSPAIESAAYFIVSEALVNVDRHARATRATVEIARVGDRLTIAVTDDGVGGAVAGADGGSGLAGLAERVAGLAGWMRVISPEGGPTSIHVELPCES